MAYPVPLLLVRGLLQLAIELNLFWDQGIVEEPKYYSETAFALDRCHKHERLLLFVGTSASIYPTTYVAIKTQYSKPRRVSFEAQFPI